MKGLLSKILPLIAFWLLVGSCAMAASGTEGILSGNSGQTSITEIRQDDVVATAGTGSVALVNDPSESWTRPSLFFECEEDLREYVLRKKHGEEQNNITVQFPSTAVLAPAFSLNDPSAFVGRGRHFNAAPPFCVVFGVFRI